MGLREATKPGLSSGGVAGGFAGRTEERTCFQKGFQRPDPGIVKLLLHPAPLASSFSLL